MNKIKVKIYALIAILLMGFGATASYAQDSVDVDDFNPKGFFTARPDFRRCVSPLCGGIFVKRVNRKLTRCADGIRRAECYVAEVDSSMLSFDPFQFLSNGHQPLLSGSIIPKDFPGFGNLGAFKVTGAYESATPTPGRRLFAGLQDNGLVCITTPCFSFDQFKLNSRRIRQISGINLNKVGASSEQLAQANKIIEDGGVLLAAGVNRQVSEAAGMGITFVAKQFYLPIQGPRLPCPEGYENIDGQCATPFGCVFPQIEFTILGGAPPIPGEEPNIQKSCVDECNPPAWLTGPGQCMIAAP